LRSSGNVQRVDWLASPFRTPRIERQAGTTARILPSPLGLTARLEGWPRGEYLAGCNPSSCVVALRNLPCRAARNRQPSGSVVPGWVVFGEICFRKEAA
jgi:hypothetical protein